MLLSLGGGLPTWVMQDACKNATLLDANLNVIRQATNVFMVTIARGCAEILRSPRVLSSLKPAMPPPMPPIIGRRHGHQRWIGGTDRSDVGSDSAGGLCPAQVVTIVVPLHYNDAEVLVAFLQSAKEFLQDIGSVSLHLIVTDDADVDRLRKAGLRDFARDWVEQRL